MANPIEFKPQPVDPSHELQKRLSTAPVDHGEALLVLWDLLEVSHREGVLDTLVGMVGAKDHIAGKISEYATLPEAVAGIRNLLALMKILGSLDPDALNCLSNAIDLANLKHSKEQKAPGIFTLIRRLNSEDSRRGLSFLTLMLGGLGDAMKNRAPKEQ